MKIVHFKHTPFELVLEERSASISVMLQRYLDTDGYKYRFKVWKNMYHFNILCDNFTDAAKVETFLATQ